MSASSSQPATPTSNRVDCLMKWLEQNRALIERPEKCSITFHIGGQNIVAEMNEKLVVTQR